MGISRSLLAVVLSVIAAVGAFGAPVDGEKLYIERCAMCHQPSGAGVPPVYPPLAGSDFLIAEREQAIKAICEGLSGRISVKGQTYDNMMPAQMLDDGQAAAVLTYVGKSWGNEVPRFSEAEVAAARAKTRFKTYGELVKASEFAPLPKAPEGWQLRELGQLPEFCTRFISGQKGEIYLLAQSGNFYRVDATTGGLELKIKGEGYLDPSRGGSSTTGAAIDSKGRLWIVANRQLREEKPVANEITIYRTESAIGDIVDLHPWFTVKYPYGVGPYNHGVSHMAFGPDGKLYVSSGSRTDGGEEGNQANFYKGGEVELTACIWQLDPEATEPKIHIFARGIRNPYGFAWTERGELFTFSNGPDANAPEEMDFIEEGKHYGFPFQFSDWPVVKGKPYPHTPVAPEGLKFTLPVRNVGPAGGGTSQGLATFDAHSCPGGAVWMPRDAPAPFRSGFLMTRFGNLIGPPASGDDVGFDLLWLQPYQSKDAATWKTTASTVLSPLGRPLDVVRLTSGAIWVLEYTRSTNFRDNLGWLPGRIIELRPKETSGKS